MVVRQLPEPVQRSATVYEGRIWQNRCTKCKNADRTSHKKEWKYPGGTVYQSTNQSFNRPIRQSPRHRRATRRCGACRSASRAAGTSPAARSSRRRCGPEQSRAEQHNNHSTSDHIRSHQITSHHRSKRDRECDKSALESLLLHPLSQ